MIRNHAVLWLLVLLTGCAPIWVSTPQTFTERMADAVATVAAVRTTATALYREGWMSADDAQQVLAQAETARGGLEVARQQHATDPEAAAARLAAEGANLQALQTDLNSRRPLPSWTTRVGAWVDKVSR